MYAQISLGDRLAYSTGEITRGMCVVDRRDDQSVYDPGANRAKVQEELEKHNILMSGILESTALPAQVELEKSPGEAIAPTAGVPVVTITPGPDVLLKLLTRRVWGIIVD